MSGSIRRDSGFTEYLCLAQSTAGNFHAVSLLDMRDVVSHIYCARLPVMPPLCNSSCRAAVDADSTGFIGEERAVIGMLCIWSWCDSKVKVYHYAPAPHRHTFFGDKTIAQTECAHTSGIQCMSLRPFGDGSSRKVMKPLP